jgi:hypothetical protein
VQHDGKSATFWGKIAPPRFFFWNLPKNFVQLEWLWQKKPSFFHVLEFIFALLVWNKNHVQAQILALNMQQTVFEKLKREKSY